jgi:pyruvate/2-oxoglutarate dehydrogenase complex dihydrolipoamide dehydrogenase (E3) component
MAQSEIPSEFDAIVVGMGVGGESAAGGLAKAGLSVLGVDHRLLGGECAYWGCNPTKIMIRAANLLAEAERVNGMAGEATIRADWTPVADRIREEATDDWDDSVAVERFEGQGGTFLRGSAHVVAHDAIEVDGQRFTARRALVLATGTTPTVPPISGIEQIDYWTNREAIRVKELPPSLIVLGGGAIGCELAQAFARFGVEVTVIEALDRLLATETPDAGRLVQTVFEREGIAVTLGAQAERIDRRGADVAVELSDGRRIIAAQLLVATGRRADPAALGADALGVDPDAPFLPVDERLRVTEGVWALGDATGKGPFTHVGTYQAGIAVADILGRDHEPADYRALPRVTFTDPEVGAVGLTPEQAQDEGLDVRIGRTEVPATTRGWIHKAGNDGFIELVEDRSRGVLVGATAAAPPGGEVLGLLSLAVHARVPTDQLRTMIYAYPTFHRGVEAALGDLAAG